MRGIISPYRVWINHSNIVRPTIVVESTNKASIITLHDSYTARQLNQKTRNHCIPPSEKIPYLILRKGSDVYLLEK